ncbi:MAG: hypothetical protein A2V86_17115 [Deltaproteobacteria bacterium RBG_16_49_23]|nr:MAG: hypothetical protein A2V86_17115 [Deltaproteobacteria bacterium RBG_16_49_23]
MKLIIAFLVSFLFFLGSGAVHGQPQVDIGVSVGPEGLNSFYFSIQDYFRVPEREVIVVRGRKIPDEELPVVFFIAQRARILPAAVIDLRLAGKTWMDITLHFGLSPEIFYVPVKVEVKGPPYGKAYGYYKNKPRKEWGKIRLVDTDIINLVNLKFVSEYHRHSAEDVIRMRSGGKHFVVVNDEIRKGRGREDSGERERGKEKEDEQGRGRGKGKGKGKDLK